MGALVLALQITGICSGSARVDEYDDNIARMNCGARLVCTMPDGNVAAVASRERSRNSTPVHLLADDTISCPLHKGDTVFVVALPPTAAVLDRFVFINENPAAGGELRIAVSNEQLAVVSEKWKPVEGSILFRHKRLFNLSLLGIDARFVKLTFHVEQENGGSLPEDAGQQVRASFFHSPARTAGNIICRIGDSWEETS